MGQFDYTPDPNGPILTPGPGLDAIFSQSPQQAPSPAPLPSFAAPISQSPQQKLLQLGSLIAAIIGGPHSGLAGLPTGVLHGQQIAQQEADRQAALQSQMQQRQESQRQAQQRIDEQKAIVRGRALQSVSNTVGGFDNKDEYDKFVEQAGQTMLLNGHRDLGPNQLRVAYPFVAPTSEKRAKKVLDAWFKNPANAEAIKKDPSLASKAVVQFDANGDGIPENVPLTKLGEIAGSPFAMGPNGQPVTLGPDLTGDKFHVALNNEIAKFTATNKRQPTSADMDALITEAGKVGKDPELTDLLKESAMTRNALLKMQQGMMPTKEDAAAIADDIVTHKLAPSQINLIVQSRGGMGSGFKTMIEREVRRMDPAYNWQEGESNYQLVKSPTFQQTVRYMDGVRESLPRLQQTANALANGNVRFVNGLRNMTGNQLNDPTLKAFRTDVLLVADEIAKILQGGGTGSGTSDAKLKQASSVIDASDSPAAIAASLKEVKFLMDNRRKSLTRGTYLENQAGAADATSDPAATGRAKLKNR